MKLSARGERFIANEEGVEKNDKGLHIPYKCPAGKWTLGYGEVISAQEVARYRNGITDAEALARFRKKLEGYVAGINKVIRVPITQNQFDMLVSIAYNNGIDAIQKSTLVRLINNRLYQQAADQFPRWCHMKDPKTGLSVEVEGLKNRRKRERAIFLQRDPEAKPQ